MRRNDHRRALTPLALAGVAAILLGAGPAKKKAEPPVLKANESIGDLAEVVGNEIHVQGIGLVSGLQGTGSDPQPSVERTRLLDDMRRARVEDADQLLASKNFSLVIVKGTIPAGITTKDRLDVEIVLPPGSTTESLAGGSLVECRLSEVAIAGGEERQGQFLARAQGPIVTGSADKPGDLKVGRVLGGGRAKTDIPYTIYINEKHQSGRTSARIEAVINERFHQKKANDLKGVAKAMNDKDLVLKVPRIYHHNQERFFRVVKLLPILDSPTLTAQRIDRWGRELLDPSKAGVAALRLEGIGKNAAETLKPALTSPNAQVRFFAAEALAYLNNVSGVDVLMKTAIEMPDFRAYALVALAAMDENASRLRLQQLLSHPDAMVRYGAFDALRTLDPNDLLLGQVRVLDQPTPRPSEDDAMAMNLNTPPQRRPQSRREEPFSLYIVDSDGPPMIHVCRTKRCEIVIFGKNQKLLTPVVLGGIGPILLNAADGDDKVQISRIVSGRSEASDLRVSSRLEIGEVIREIAQVGATYPDILLILQGALKQRNLPGPLFFDARPMTNPKYEEAQLVGKDASKKDSDVKQTKMDKTRRPRIMDWLRRRTSRAKIEK